MNNIFIQLYEDLSKRNEHAFALCVKVIGNKLSLGKYYANCDLLRGNLRKSLH